MRTLSYLCTRFYDTVQNMTKFSYIFPPLLTFPLAATANAPDSVRHVALGEVTITTVKEEGAARLQPSSVSLLSREQLEAQHVTSIKGTTGLVPGLFIPDYGSRLTSAIYIRGVGSRSGSPAVGLYVDNIPYADKSAFDTGLYDIERLDVLRGPQGTLYGRGAMGGIMRVYTKNPFNYEGTDLHLGYATGDNHRRASLTHYHQVSDRFAFSGGGYYEGGSGLFTNSFTGKDADHMESGGARIRGIFRTGDHLTIDFSANYDYSDEGAYPYFYNGSLTDPEFCKDHIGTIANNREGTYRRSLFTAGADVRYTTDAWTMDAITSYQNIGDHMMMDQDFLPLDIYTLGQDQRINTVAEEVTFKSRSNSRFSRWHWVSGGNVMFQTLNTEAPVTFYADGLRWLEQNINRHMPDVTQIPSLSRMGFSSMSTNFRGDELALAGTYDTPTFNAALFHQSTVDFTPQLSFTLGLRLDYEHKRLDYFSPADVAYGFTLANPRAQMMHVDLQNLESHILYDGTQKNDYLTVLPKGSFKYELADGLGNVYISAAKGHRTGGYNIQMFSELLQASMQNAMMSGIQQGVEDYLQKFVQMGMPPTVIGSVTTTMKENMPIGEDLKAEQVVYKPELSWNYELGTHLNLLGRRLMLDAAAFFIDTRDQQISRFAPSGLGRMMVNAGRSQSYGAELTTAFRPDNHWALTANYGYTHATFTDYDAGGGVDYTDNYVPFVPQHTVHLNAAYTWQFPAVSWLDEVTLGADYSGAGRIYWTEANNASQDFYSLLGARMAFEMPHCSLQLWGRNLTATKYNTFYFETVGRCFEQHGKPLQVGVDLNIHF